ncbi:uncharacterized protein TOT_020000880 [Theileria orientalis strain Shintoku]|uniref:Uncharacterized protein n=1 Tax=Theileria orientalis strain Shintoku TaxID=869250 RepID=J4CD70_THEOR|nr:uncharacterized protein TOT_020000880 [Theileria orientalis strain Shintoku]BAM40627.1 uncharacterized protein TOT_020000880 [Theileria orientalis strain Shintoku]|eukprot:XP_009690928.1 uncharacterized protein TOT_020000880 [Theileria orientalis strain Shintoku]
MIVTRPKLTFSYPSSRKLGDIVKLKLLEKLPRRRIIEIWKQNYEEDTWVYTDCITGEQYERINSNQRHNRNFILPVRKGVDRYYNLFSQFISDKIVLLTALEKYKQYSISDGTPDLVVTMYDELKSTHDLVLLKMDIVNDKDIDKRESEVVLGNLLTFYTDFNLFRWVRKFNNTPREFIYTDYIRENNNMFNLS